MKQPIKDEANLWLKQAESDFSILNTILNAGKFDLVCFLSQQVAEKALKAYLLFQGEEFITSHSIAKLCDLCSNFDKKFLSLKKKIKGLTPYYVEARYPNALEEMPALYFDIDDAKDASKMAEEALNFVKERLKV